MTRAVFPHKGRASSSQLHRQGCQPLDGAFPLDGGDDDKDADAGSDTTGPDDDIDDFSSFTSQQITAIQI